MTSRRSLAALLSLSLAPGLGLALAARLGSQAAAPPDSSFSEAIDVDLVNLDVFVADRSGRPVAGLARGDFAVLVDGKPVAITNFSAFSAPGRAGHAPEGAAPAPPASPAAGEEHATLAIYLDSLNMTPDLRNLALRSLSKFYQNGLEPHDRVLIASYDGKGVKLRHPPAGDGPAVVAALREAARETTKGTTVRAERRQILSDIGNAETEGEVEEAVERREMLEIEHEGDAQRGLRALTQFVDSLAGLHGRKSLLYVASEAPVPLGDSLYRTLAEHANAGRVTLYALGLPENVALTYYDIQSVHNTEISPLQATAPGDQLQQQLHQMAGPTGGLTMIDPNRPAYLLDRIREDFRSFYSLGFAPPQPADERPHKIEVRVPGRGGLEVRFPATYVPRTREQRLAARTQTALLLETPGAVQDNPLGVRLGFERDELAAYGRRAVTVLVTLPLARVALQPGQGVHEGKVEIFLAARDSTGHDLRMRRITMPIHVPDGELAAALARRVVAYRLHLELPPGSSTIALGVRDELGGGESTVATRYTAGALATAKAAAPPPAPGAPPGEG